MDVEYAEFEEKVLQVTGSEKLADVSYDSLSRAVNKVCKEVFDGKPKTEELRNKQANFKRKIKAIWRTKHEAAPGAIPVKIEEVVTMEEQEQEQPSDPAVVPEQQPSRSDATEEQIAALVYVNAAKDQEIAFLNGFSSGLMVTCLIQLASIVLKGLVKWVLKV